MFKKFFEYIAMTFFAFLTALNYSVFVFPNKFAPAGIDGICTMIQDISNINMGYLALFVNIPLIIAAFFILNRDFAIKSTIFVLSFSLSMILLKHIDISKFYYATNTGTSIVLSPIAAGTIRGILYSVTLRFNGSGGGIDIIAALIKKNKPHLNFMNILFFINMLIALSSYFVYDMMIEPVICSMLYSFINSNISNTIRLSKIESVKFEIITSDAQELCSDISSKTHQKATIIDAQGAYTGNNRKIILCVAEKEKAPYVEDLILKYSDCIVFKSTVSNSISGIGYK